MEKINRIRLFTFMVTGSIIFLTLGCNKADDDIPALITATVSNITQTSATSGGRIRGYDSADYSAVGVCWGTDDKPTIDDNITTDTTSTGIFTSKITGLTPNTKYYIRAYATGSGNTEYGNVISFTTGDYGKVTDIDGNDYKTLTIGTQTWMIENLKVTHYQNGDLIENVTENTEWSTIKIGAYCHYENSLNNNKTYGNLYNWYALYDDRNIAPAGWHVPTDAEWTKLIDYLINNGFGYQGSGRDICKSMASQSGWTLSKTEGATGFEQLTNNSSGFTALPGGCRDPEGVFQYIEGYGFWWNTTPYSLDDAYYLCIYSHYFDVYRVTCSKRYGFSVRCVMD